MNFFGKSNRNTRDGKPSTSNVNSKTVRNGGLAATKRSKLHVSFYDRMYKQEFDVYKKIFLDWAGIPKDDPNFLRFRKVYGMKRKGGDSNLRVLKSFVMSGRSPEMLSMLSQMSSEQVNSLLRNMIKCSGGMNEKPEIKEIQQLVTPENGNVDVGKIERLVSSSGLLQNQESVVASSVGGFMGVRDMGMTNHSRNVASAVKHMSGDTFYRFMVLLNTFEAPYYMQYVSNVANTIGKTLNTPKLYLDERFLKLFQIPNNQSGKMPPPTMDLNKQQNTNLKPKNIQTQIQERITHHANNATNAAKNAVNNYTKKFGMGFFGGKRHRKRTLKKSKHTKKHTKKSKHTKKHTKRRNNKSKKH
jgi:hypothetical protein